MELNEDGGSMVSVPGVGSVAMDGRRFRLLLLPNTTARS